MADLTRPTPDYRKQAFAGSNTSAWPTPPTEVEHDFASTGDMDKSMRTLSVSKGEDKMAFAGMQGMHSPPASPVQGWSRTLPPMHSNTDIMDHSTLPPINDTQLFSEPSITESQSPLFSQDKYDSLSPQSRQASPAASKPTPIEPPLPKRLRIDEEVLKIFPQFRNADSDFFRQYRIDRYQELKDIPGWRPVTARSPGLPPLSATPQAERSFKIVKSKEPSIRVRPVSQAKAKVPRTSMAASPVAKPIRNTTSIKRERQTASAEPQARKRAPPSKPQIVDNWLEIADYSPPTQTLDSMTMRLRVHWKGVPNDLSSDPESKFLHPQEIEIAQELKLPANQYLANKRRIFEARFKSIKDHKNFTKTAAQQACNIDVNKTSQLYEAYEKVGWFDEANFKQWLA